MRERVLTPAEQQELCLLWRDYGITPYAAEHEYPEWQIQMALAEIRRRHA